MRAYDESGTHERGDVAVERFAADRFGAFSWSQATALGVTSGVVGHNVRIGRWRRAGRGVYVIASSRDTWERRLMVAHLRRGDSVVSHASAGRLWSLPPCAEAATLELTLPRTANRRDAGAILHFAAVEPGDVATFRNFRVTTPARSLLDLAAVLGRDQLEVAVDDALRRRLVSPSRLRRQVEQGGRRGRRGVVSLRELVEERWGAAPAESVLETRLLSAMRRAGLRPENQHEVKEQGRLVARLDFAFPRERVAVEADGFRYHGGRASFESDRRRQNALTALGWRVVRVTWRQMQQDPDAVVATIAGAIRG